MSKIRTKSHYSSVIEEVVVKVNAKSRQAQHMETLSRMVIRAYCDSRQATAHQADFKHSQDDLRYVAALGAPELSEFLALADAHHVIMRALTVLENAATLENEERIAEWCASSLAAERDRIERAISFLHRICVALESRGCKVVVIKTLDHWPDLGSDLDLYTTADSQCVGQITREQFGAHPVERSWGDRLANKWNYRVPGLPELVEIHVQYLGQTGEHAEMGQRVIDRRVRKTVAGRDFHVPAAEERIVIAALQRVYRHFYFRLCDMVDITLLLRTETVHSGELKMAANTSGIWPGVATFLCLIRNYIESFGGVVPLPDEVLAPAHCRESDIRFQGGFLRVPKTTAANLYSRQLVRAGLRRDVRALLRLPLLPPLAVTAWLAHSLAGKDKGIW